MDFAPYAPSGDQPTGFVAAPVYGEGRAAIGVLAFEMPVDRINRVILLSDGLANVGPSSTSDLKALGRSLSRQGISVSTIGVGDDYNEDLMAGLAEASDANYYYVKDAESCRKYLPRNWAVYRR